MTQPIKVDVKDLNLKTWFMLITLISAMTVASYFGVKGTIDIDFNGRVLQALQQEINSSASFLEKPCSYLIGVLGSYYYMANGSNGQITYFSTNASAVINNAIGNLTAGGKIFFKAGTYNLDKGSSNQGCIGIRSTTPNVVLQGEGTATVLRRNYDADVNGVIYVDQTHNVTIQDLMIDGNGDNVSAHTLNMAGIHSDQVTGLNILNVKVYNTYEANIWVQKTNFSKVVGCDLIETNQTNGNAGGLKIYTCTDFIASQNFINNTGYSGVTIQTSSRNVQISDNSITNSSFGICIGGDGVGGQLSHDITIQNNHIEYMYDGIRLEDGVYDVNVEHNHVLNATRYGTLVLLEGIGQVIEGNTYINCTSYGVDLTCANVTVNNNHFFTALGVNCDNGAENNTSIINNRFLCSGAQAVRIFSGNYRVYVDGNNFYGSADDVAVWEPANQLWGTNVDKDGALDVGAEP